MIIGVPREIKQGEYRVSVVPVLVEALAKAGHTVLVQTDAGRGTGISDAEYSDAGAKIVASTADAYSADLVVKVKEPQPNEYPLIREGQIVFTYFHFAASRELTQAMIDSGAVCLAYETIEDLDGSLPALTPMSEVAGRMAVHEGAKFLERPMEGRGILLGGVPGVTPATVVVLGGGVAGANAAKMAAGLGANVIVLDVNLDRLRYLDDVMPPNVTTLFSNSYNIKNAIASADLVIGAVLRHGAKTPVLVTREMLKLMRPRAVIVDIAVDQGGAFETSRPTTHSHPTFIEEGIVHYCVANMPGAVAGTSTYALTNVTGRYVLQIANKGLGSALTENPALRRGLNIAGGKVVHPAVAELFGHPLAKMDDVL